MRPEVLPANSSSKESLTLFIEKLKTFSDPSSEPEAMNPPSGDHATDNTASVYSELDLFSTII